MISFVLVMLVLIFLYTSRRKYYKDKYGSNLPPDFEGNLPIIGHSLLVAGDFINIYKTIQTVVARMFETNQHVVGLQLAFWKFYGIIDPDDCTTIGNSGAEKHYVYNFIKPWLGNGLATAPGVVWKAHRKIVCRALSQPLLDKFLDDFNSSSKCIVERFEQHVGELNFDPIKILKPLSLNTICSTAMGFRDSVNDNEKIQYITAARKLFNLTMQRGFKFWLHSDLLYSMSNLKKEYDENTSHVHKLTNKFIAQRKQEILQRRQNGENNNGQFGRGNKSFLEQLVELSLEGDLTDKEVADEVATMTVAGYETIISAMTGVLSIIGSYPVFQEKAYTEIKEIFGDSDREVEKSDIARLKYLDAIIKESMRIYPPATIVIRYVEKDLKLKNCIIPAGSNCFVGLYGANRHPVWGKDANEYNPERWLDPATLPANPNAFAVFSVGKRNCIGGNYAMMYMKTQLVYILRRFRITADHTKIIWKVRISSVAHSGHEILLEKRQ